MSACVTHGCGMRRGCSRVATLACRDWRQAEPSLIGLPESSRARSRRAKRPRRSRRKPNSLRRAPRALSFFPISRVSALPSSSRSSTPKAAWFGFNLKHTRADTYRALLEGIANATNHVIETYVEAGHGPHTISAVGGGTRNRVWIRRRRTSSGGRRCCALRPSGPPMGTRFWPHWRWATLNARPSSNGTRSQACISPRPAYVEVYARQFAIYKDLYGATRSLMERLTG